jgi:hypothetical protein
VTDFGQYADSMQVEHENVKKVETGKALSALRLKRL